MRHGLTPFAVSIHQIRSVIGSRSKSILLELREEFEDELQEDREAVDEANSDDEFDPELALDDALRHLIMDEERWDYEGPKYGFALEMLCSFYGEFLTNDHWSEIHWEWAETVHDALVEIGVDAELFSVFNFLIGRGAPVSIPDIEEFPYIGYVELDEIPSILAALSDKRFSAIQGEDAQAVRDSLLQVRAWLETCRREKSDLVCFYY